MDIKAEIKSWWAKNPQTYGKEHGQTTYQDKKGNVVTLELGTKEFFINADSEFYSWNFPLHSKEGHFSKIFPYSEFKNKKVLEIGCGMGAMLMNWAQHGAIVTGVDLNPVSIEQTKKRFEIYGLKGVFKEEDANKMSFKDNEFDYVYSWGVLHHSPNIDLSIKEMFRVLKKGGKFGLMLYNRNSILYYYTIRYLEGFINYENRFNTKLALASRYTDGRTKEGNPHTWPLTSKEVKNLLSPYAENLQTRLLGTDLDFSLKLLVPGIGAMLPRFIKKCWARRFGWSIWANGIKK